MGRVALIVLLFLVPITIAPAKQLSSFVSGNWSGGAYGSDTTGQFSHCSAAASFNSGIMMLVAVGRNFDWTLGFQSDSWQLQIGSSLSLRYRIDAGPWLYVAAHAVDRTAIVLPMPPEGTLIAAFRQGHTFQLYDGSNSYFFDLTGTSALFIELATCTRQWVASEQVRQQPALSPPSTSPPNSGGGFLGLGLNLILSQKPLLDPIEAVLPMEPGIWQMEAWSEQEQNWIAEGRDAVNIAGQFYETSQDSGKVIKLSFYSLFEHFFIMSIGEEPTIYLLVVQRTDGLYILDSPRCDLQASVVPSNFDMRVDPGLCTATTRDGLVRYFESIAAREPQPTGRIVQVPEAQASPAPASSGSAFVLNRDGYIITNNHVVAGCRSVVVKAPGWVGNAEVVATDTYNDLALLHVPYEFTHSVSLSETGDARLGEHIVVMGFPLQQFLAEQVNVTDGTISSLAGPGEDERLLQITAPIQPGNSGGPVLDMSGHLVGIVVSKLKDQIADATGAIPQNVNFAIKGSVLRQFLDGNHVAYNTAGRAELTVPDVAESGANFTARIKCWSE